MACYEKGSIMNKLLLVFLSMITTAGAMQQPLKDWVRNATAVTIRTEIEKQTWKVPIGNTTSIGDLKNRLYNLEGMEVDQQLFYSSTSNPWTLWMTSRVAGPFDNSEVVKKVMNEQNTATFLVCLRLRFPKGG